MKFSLSGKSIRPLLRYRGMDLKNFIGNGDSFSKDLRAGSLLLASPLMHEDHFSRSVILLLDVDREKGSLGLVLNKPLNLTMGEILKGWEEMEHIPLYTGGPVDNSRLFMLHRLGDAIRGSVELTDGLYIGNNLGDAFRYLELGGKAEGEIRFFLGYSGWTEGQLEREIFDQAWAVDDAADYNEILDGEGESYWRRYVSRLGDAYRPWLLMPERPSDN